MAPCRNRSLLGVFIQYMLSTKNLHPAFHFNHKFRDFMLQSGKAANPLSKCMACKYARYCNKECQKKAWREHKNECAAIQRVSPGQPEDQTRLVARLLWKRTQNRIAGKKELVDIQVILFLQVAFCCIDFKIYHFLQNVM